MAAILPSNQLTMQPVHRVLVLANKDKPEVRQALGRFRPWLQERATVAGEVSTMELHREAAMELPEADLAIVLGGDGTMLSQARAMVDRGIPLLGVNFGKVGFLAEFTLDDLMHHWQTIAAGACPTTRRLMVDVTVYPAGAPEWGGNGEGMPEPVFSSVAMNDAVITAGPPYRMLDIELAVEPREARTSAANFTGDGVIVSTPSGSTAYNVAAGGPIISPGIDGLCVTAICPHTLAFRPIVFNANSETWLAIHRANEGTTLVIDGQVSDRIEAGQQMLIQKHPRSVHLVHNPSMNYWKMLAHKMHWAARPRSM